MMGFSPGLVTGLVIAGELCSTWLMITVALPAPLRVAAA